MKRILTSLVLIMLIATNQNYIFSKGVVNRTVKNYTTNANKLFYGTWIVTKVIASGKVSAYGKKEINKILGSKITYSEKIVTFNNNKLKNPYYEIATLSKNEFFTGSYVKLDKIGIQKDNVNKVEIFADKAKKTLWDSTASTFFIKDKNSLVLFDGGIYFELDRKK